MIAKLTVGNGLRGAVAYDLTPKKGEPNRAEWIGGTLGGIGATPKQVSRQGGLLRALRPEIKNPIWRCSLSLPPSDGRRDAAFWKKIAEEFLTEMEIPLDAGWLAVRHDDVEHDHIHLSVVRILHDSTLWNRANDLPKAVKATQKLEQRHGLASHSREKPKKSSSTLADRQMSKRKSQPMPKQYVQNEIDDIFKNHTDGLEVEKLQTLLAAKGVGLDEKRTKLGKLQGLSFRCEGTVFPASALGTDYSTNGLIKRGLRVKDQIYVVDTGKPTLAKPIATPIPLKSKMPQMLKPFMASPHVSHEVRTHAAHQTEVMDAPKLNKAIANLSVGPASKAMLLIGFALINFSAEIVRRIIALMRRILAAFGFGMRESGQLQKYEHPSGEAICYEPTRALPATLNPSAEEKAADELSRIAHALDTNSPNELPVVEGAEKERADAVAAMTFPDRLSGVAAVTENDVFCITDEDFSSGAVAFTAENHKTDLIQALKEALEADKIASEALDLAKTKKVPFHIDISDRTGEEVDIVVKALDLAKANFERWKSKNFIKAQFPSTTKNNFEYEIANLEKQKTEVTVEHKKATAKTAEHEWIKRNLPEPVVPMSVLLNAEAASQAVKTARDTIQLEALSLIESIKSNLHQTDYVARILKENESQILRSWKNFEDTKTVSKEYVNSLIGQLSELQRLKNMQKNVADAVIYDRDGSHDKPMIDGQIVK
jgi:hypothetical protein